MVNDWVLKKVGQWGLHWAALMAGGKAGPWGSFLVARKVDLLAVV